MADLAGWPYWKVVSITGQSGAGTDYQTKITMGDSAGGDFHLEGHCTNFPQDIRITDDDGTTLLDHWVEDLTADPIVVHVKVNDDLGANRDIRVYYGKSGEATASNGANTFSKLFRDFEDDNLSDWSNQGVTLETQSSVYYSGAKALRYYHSGSIFYGYVGLQYDAVLTTGDIVEFMYQYGSNSNTGIQIVPAASTWNDWNNRADVITNANSMQTYDSSWVNIATGLSTDTWYKASFVIDRTSDNFDSWHEKSTSESPSLNNAGIRGTLSGVTNIFQIAKGASGNCVTEGYIDNLLIRKYNSPEPAFSSAGAEQTPGVGAAPTSVFYGPLVGPFGGPI